MRRPLLLAALALLLPGCPETSLLLLDGSSGEPLADTPVKIWIDDGVRCITTPCPTASRAVEGRTDARGRLVLPELGERESVTLSVEGFQPGPPPKDGGPLRLRLEGDDPARPEAPLQLRAALDPGTPTLRLRVKNAGTEPLDLVHPRSDHLARYAAWGGWELLVKVGGDPFLPEPLPGPYIAATPEELERLAPGEEREAVIDLARWRRHRPGELVSEAPLLAQTEGRLTVRLSWAKLPSHLKAEHPAPRAMASARTHLRPTPPQKR